MRLENSLELKRNFRPAIVRKDGMGFNDLRNPSDIPHSYLMYCFFN
jgi:hypothetical protein